VLPGQVPVAVLGDPCHHVPVAVRISQLYRNERGAYKRARIAVNDAKRSDGMPLGERAVLPRFIAAVGRRQNARNGRCANTVRDELLQLQIGGYTSAD